MDTRSGDRSRARPRPEKPVRIAVIGAGHLGSYHLQKARLLEAENHGKDMVLAGVVDVDAKRAALAGATYQVPFATSLDHLQTPVDAAVIATPTVSHAEVAHNALQRGLHLLVEKPMTTTAHEGETLCEAAARARVVLQIGHVERFNPAVRAAFGLMGTAPQLGFVACERMGPFSGRSTDIDIVKDVMIHDLDLCLALLGDTVCEVRAVGVPIFTQAVDMASVRLAFESGAVAQLSAGRASLKPVRKLRLFTADRYISVDCGAGTVTSLRRYVRKTGADTLGSRARQEQAENGAAPPQIGVESEPVAVAKQDALETQLRHFVTCIRQEQTPLVDGVAGLRALRLAETVAGALQVPLAAALAA